MKFAALRRIGATPFHLIHFQSIIFDIRNLRRRGGEVVAMAVSHQLNLDPNMTEFIIGGLLFHGLGSIDSGVNPLSFAITIHAAVD